MRRGSERVRGGREGDEGREGGRGEIFREGGEGSEGGELPRLNLQLVGKVRGGRG